MAISLATPSPPDWHSPGIEVFFHYPSRQGRPARVKAFVEFMLARLRKLRTCKPRRKRCSSRFGVSTRRGKLAVPLECSVNYGGLAALSSITGADVMISF